MAWTTIWKATVGFFLAGGIFSLLLAGLLALTKTTFDFHIHDRYMLVLPRYSLLASAVLWSPHLSWKAKGSHQRFVANGLFELMTGSPIKSGTCAAGTPRFTNSET
jgi:hypothetical protein